MRIEVHTEDTSLNIRMPLISLPAKLIIKEMLKDMDDDGKPSKKGMRHLAKESVKILKQHKGIVFVDVESDDGTTVKITI
jgi:hypothetical protein